LRDSFTDESVAEAHALEMGKDWVDRQIPSIVHRRPELPELDNPAPHTDFIKTANAPEAKLHILPSTS
jgi:hypothetical protein